MPEEFLDYNDVEKIKKELVKNKVSLGDHARALYEDRYLNLNPDGTMETIEERLASVAIDIASAELKYNKDYDVKKLAFDIYEAMREKKFIFNSPTIMNFGKFICIKEEHKQLDQMGSACFVIPVCDCMTGKDEEEVGILDALKYQGLIHKSGGGCIIQGSKIYTSELGISNIEDLYNRFSDKPSVKQCNGRYTDISLDNIFTFSYNKDTGKFVKDKITRVWKYDVDNAVTLSLQGGTTLTTSDYHPVFVLEDGDVTEKRSDEVSLGDYVVSPNYSIQNSWNKEYSFVDGIRIDEDLAWAIGFFIGDGSVSYKSRKKKDKGFRLRAFNNDKKVLDKFNSIISSVFGVPKTKIQEDSRRDCFNYVLQSNDTIARFTKIVRAELDEKVSTVNIPSFLHKSPISVIHAMFAGFLDSDGHICKNRNRFEYSTISKELSEQMVSLLSILGYNVSIQTKPSKRSNERILYVIKVSGESFIDFTENILDHVSSSSKKERIINKRLPKKSVGLDIPFNQFEDILNEVGVATTTTFIHRNPVTIGEESFWLHLWKQGKNIDSIKFKRLVVTLLKEDISEKSRDYLKRILNVVSGIKKVVDIEIHKNYEPFYDLTVENNNNYLSGKSGLSLIHNTGFSFADLRPSGSKIGYKKERDGDRSIDWNSPKGVSSGPLSFLKYMFDSSTKAVKQGNCLTPDTLVFTENGVLRLDEICDTTMEGFKDANFYLPTDEGDRMCSECYNNGTVSVKEVKTKDGFSLKGTGEHRVKVFRDGKIDWVSLDDLKIGDKVYTKLGKYRGNVVKLEEPKSLSHFNKKDINYPKYLSNDFAFFLGLLYGDGFISSGDSDYRVGITCNKDSYLFDEIPQLFSNIFGLSCTIYTKDDDNSVTFVSNSKSLKEFLIYNGFDKKHAANITVPKNVRISPEEVLCSFLEGAFETDGSILHKHACLHSSSKQYIDEIAVLMRGLGIPVKIKEVKQRNDGFRSSEGVIYSLNTLSIVGISNFIKKLSFDRRSRFSALSAENVDLSREKSFPVHNYKDIIKPVLDAITLDQSVGKGKKFRSTNSKLCKQLLRYLREDHIFTVSSYMYLSNKYEDFRNNAPSIDLTDYFDEVVSVVNAGKSLTLDLTVDGNHTYIANGFVSHNSRRGANMGVQRIDHPDFLDHIYAKFNSSDNQEISNFNLSLAVTDEFMECAKKDSYYRLYNPHTEKHLVLEDVCSQERFEEIRKKNKINPSAPMTIPSLYMEKGSRDVINAYTGKAIGFYDGEYIKIRARSVLFEISRLAAKNGEPGLIYIDRMNEFNPTPNLGSIKCTNPCLSGDTLVAVADGRNSVSIKELAEEGKDVPVYCLDEQGKIAIKKMRNPRITGYDEQMYKVTISNGHSIRVTGNHKFRISAGEYRKAKDLKMGDSLLLMDLNDVTCLSWELESEGVQYVNSSLVDHDSEDIQEYKEALSQGYNAKIEDGVVFVKKVCEHCNNTFSIPYKQREVAFCSFNCNYVADRNTERVQEYLSEESETCKVISVEKDGRDVVYNGTVDEFHNFFVGGFREKNSFSSDKFLYLNNLQCGEQPLQKLEACNLGSINLSSFVKYSNGEPRFSFKEMAKYIRILVRALDNVIDRNDFPIEGIRKAVNKTRKIGLGVMGFADALYKLKIPYDSEKAIEFAESIAKSIAKHARNASKELAKEKEVFPAFKGSIYDKNSDNFLEGKTLDYDIKLRNATVTTIAPTGSTSRLCETSSGIEPSFSLAYISKINNNEYMNVSNGFVEIAKREGFYSEELMGAIKANDGKVKWNEDTDERIVEELKVIPEEYREIFQTSAGGDISSACHVDVQATFQKYCDSSISKTITFPAGSDESDVLESYFDAWEKGCKGITVYIDKSRDLQVLNTTGSTSSGKDEEYEKYHRPLAQQSFTVELPFGNPLKKIGEYEADSEVVFTTIAFDPINKRVNSIFQNTSYGNSHEIIHLITENKAWSKLLKRCDGNLSELEEELETLPSAHHEGSETEDGTMRTRVNNDTTPNAALKTIYFMKYITNCYQNWSFQDMNDRMKDYLLGKVTLKEIIKFKGELEVVEEEGLPSILPKNKDLVVNSSVINPEVCPYCKRLDPPFHLEEGCIMYDCCSNSKCS